MTVRGLAMLILCLGACAAPSRAAGSQPTRAAVVTRGQTTLAKRGTIRVRVVTQRRGPHSVLLRLRDRAPGSRAVVAARTTLTGRPRSRELRLRLRPAARRLVGTCRTLRAELRVRRGGRTVAKARATLRRDRRCAGSGPGGDGGVSGPPVAPGFDTSTIDRCDPGDPALCLLPFPNDSFTVPDSKTPTGRRLNLQAASMPKDIGGKSIDPTDFNSGDGFSPGSLIVAHVPRLDTPEAFRATGAPPIDDPLASLRADSPVVVLDATAGGRALVWSELDSNPADPKQRNLLVRPARNLLEGHRYIVALRRMRAADGHLLSPARAFAVYRDRIVTTDPKVEARRAHMEQVFGSLGSAGVARDDLYLAWDFTVASAKSTTQRMLSIRDRAFAELGDANLADGKVAGRSPTFTINPDDPTDAEQTADADGIRDFPKCDATNAGRCDDRIARVVRGQFAIPCFLDRAGCPTGAQFAYAAGDRLTPQRLPGNTYTQDFTCIIPRVALDGPSPQPMRVSLYGHGLFGGQGEIGQGQLKSLANEHGFVFCATDWDGMATKDVPNALTVLQDLSRFPTLIDHVEQGFLNFLFLGRTMIHGDGLASSPAFRSATGKPVIDTSALYYDGNSQGGIYGGALTAIAPDFRRSVLGVVGMNYSTLLARSTDFDTYAKGEFEGFNPPLGGLYDAYPNELERPLIFSLLQILWDRADPDGYAQHMTTDPLPNTPSHTVLMHVGFGDHQVADVSAEVQARTIGARIHTPALEPGRARFRDRPYPGAPEPAPFAAINPLGSDDHGSGIVFWDIGPLRDDGAGGQLGTLAPPATDVPNRIGKDPHEAPRNALHAREQKSDFLRPDGVIHDYCGGPCFAFKYRGAP